MNSFIAMVVVVFLQGVGQAPVVQGLIVPDLATCQQLGQKFKVEQEKDDKVKDVEFRCIVIPTNNQKV